MHKFTREFKKIFAKNNKGFTLIEMVVVVVLTPLLFIGISEVFIFTSNNYHYANNVRKVTQEVRGALEAIARETREASYVNANSSSDILTITSKDGTQTEFKFQSGEIIATSPPVTGTSQKVTSAQLNVLVFDVVDSLSTTNISQSFIKLKIEVEGKQVSGNGQKSKISLETVISPRTYNEKILYISSFAATPNSGNAPFSPELKATAYSSGFSDSEKYTWKFYLNDTDTTPCATFDNVTTNLQSATTCTYNTAGVYTAKVKVTRGGITSEAIVSVSVGNPIITLNPTADASADRVSPNFNSGSSSQLLVGGMDGTHDTYALMKFDLTPLAGKTIHSASLKLYCKTMETVHINRIRPYRITGDWVESTVTYNTRPGYSTTDPVVNYTDVQNCANAWFSFDTTTLVSGWARSINPYTNYGFFLYGSQVTSYFTSREEPTSTIRPQLVVQYTP
ncbi:TPA: hypothetical protein DDW69_02890 [candidate division CPR2 bacterium]|uniref:Collagen triple helix repeat-containing protein n=1 Tax=candidate division CPR2 bacterium GW2011_GWC1_41_48 TaxID=1618344 RepID=A0A0G0WAS1_UNCC2|nr:MAG: Collagen triple helix repeat-containing protein [candidate division CPR2 bacterium GW2011_GWC2_39_35]KKR27485.1 MAG: Collagen triple helix repeat-containing protein [candidate division CPR2 bacterium GW2011_GWD2_39_7]KKS09162.1 MAG: Collagen triple helix repeat-containing protein [candidate division CPR2 bacterium GW2011_GWC1_41_48]OGB71210.1 MAG: hypothetical protein A2Y26_05545 [candidate division CPR2 bacterium GWD2_39_7]HBG81766.1 hypothetical protein [candidate division CPR2 bacter